MPKDIAIWKTKDGKIVETDTGFEDQMTSDGYVPASDAEADAYLAKRKGAAPVPYTGNAVSKDTIMPPPAAPGQPQEEPVDEGLVKKIMDTSAGAGTSVSREEAVQRARRTTTLVKSGAPTIGQNKEYEDAGSKTGAAVEGYIRGLFPFELVGAVEGGAGEFLQMAGWENNPFTYENIEARRAANPYTAGTAEVAGVATTLGSSALIKGGVNLAEKAGVRLAEMAAERGAEEGISRTIKKGATKGVEKLGQTMEAAGTALRTGDIISKTGEGVSTGLGARVAGTSVKREVALAENEIGAILEREAAGYELSKSEQAVLDSYKKASKPNLSDKWRAKLISDSQDPALIAKVAEERAVRERAAVVIKKKVGDSFEKLGIGKGLGNAGVQTIAGAAAGAVAGGSHALSRGYMERQAMTQEQVDALGESLGSEVIKGTLEGGVFGGILSAAGATLPQVMRYSLAGVRKANESLTKLLGPRAAALTGKDPDKVRAGLTFADVAAQIDYNKELKALTNALQHQYDNALGYVEGLQKFQENLMATAGAQRAPSNIIPITARTNLNRAERDFLSSVMREEPLVGMGVQEKMLAIRQKYLTQVEKGKWVYNPEKLKEALKNQEITTTFEPGSRTPKFEIKLPEEIELLQKDIDDAAADLHGVMVNLEEDGAFSILPPPSPRTIADRITYAAPEAEPYLLPPSGKYEPMAPISGIQLDTSVPSEGALGAARILKGQEMVNKTFQGGEDKGSLIRFAAGSALAKFMLNLGVGKSVGLGYAANALYKFATRPEDAIKSYEVAQKILYKSEEAMNSLTKYLTSTAKYTPRGTTLDSLVDASGLKAQYKADKDVIKSFDAGDAEALYRADKGLLDNVAAQMDGGDLSKMFGQDYEQLDLTYPNLANGAGGLLPRAISFLNEKMKATTPAPNAYLIGNKPTSKAIYEYGIYSKYVRDPDAIYDDIGTKGYVPSQAIEVLQRVYPARYSQLQVSLLGMLADAQANRYRINKRQRGIIDKILDRSTDGMSVAQINALQQTFQQNAPAQGQGGGTSNRRVELERSGTSQGK